MALTKEAVAIHTAHDKKLRERAKARREKYNAIENFKNPMTVRIKQWEGRAITGGSHFPGSDFGGRKIYPGEVICVDAGDPEFAHLFETFEPVQKPITRPIIFEHARQARVTTPNPKVRAQFELSELKAVRETIQAECYELNQKLQTRRAQLAGEAKQAASDMAAAAVAQDEASRIETPPPAEDEPPRTRRRPLKID